MPEHPATHLASHPAPASGAARQATAREFFAVIFRRKWLILGLFAVTTATVVTIAFITPTVYVSSGRVLVRRGELESALLPYRQVFNSWEEELGSEVEVAKSWDVLQRAQAMLAAQPGPKLKVTPKQVDAEVLGKSNVLGISYQDQDPGVARRVADAVIQAYIEYRMKNMMLTVPHGFFEREIADAVNQRQRLMEERRRYATAEGVVDLPDQQRSGLSLLETLRQRRNETTANLAESQTLVRAMQSLAQDPQIDIPTIVSQGANEQALMDIKRNIVEQETRVAELRERYRDDSPEVTNAVQTLATLRDMMRKEAAARITVESARLDALKSRLTATDKDIAAVEAQLAPGPSRQAVLDRLDQEIDAQQKRYVDLLQKSRDARVTEYTTPPVNVLLLSPAGPGVPRNARDYVRLGLAPAFSLVVGIGLAFFVDGLDLTVRTAGQAEETLDLPVLAAITERRRRTG